MRRRPVTVRTGRVASPSEIGGAGVADEADAVVEVLPEPDRPPPPPAAEELISATDAPPAVLDEAAAPEEAVMPEEAAAPEEAVVPEEAAVLHEAAALEPVLPDAPGDDVGTLATDVLSEALTRLRAAGPPRERFAIVAELAEVPLDGEALVTVLDALPPGWQRRTALRTLVRGGGDVEDLDAAAVLERFGRPSERTAAAHLLVGAGLAHLGTVVDHLDHGAAARLRRRRA